MENNSRKVPTFCRICEPGCGLLANVENGKVLKLEPDKNHPVHKGFACHKGLTFTQVHNDPDRLDRPLRRLNQRQDDKGDFQAVSWDEAMADIATRIQAIQAKYGDTAVAGFYGNPTAFNSTSTTALPQTLAKLGSRRVFSSATQDCSNKMAGSEAVFGTSLLHPIPDLLHSDYFLCIGGNPKVSHMSFVHTTAPMDKIRDIKKRGGKVVFLNPRNIESSTPATGEVLLIKPDTDVYFLAAVIHHVLAINAVDRLHVEQYGKNVEGLFDFVNRYSPERAAAVTGIDAVDICQVAKDFSQAKAASIHMSTGVNMGRQGTLAYWLLNMLSFITGNLGRKGGNIYSPGFFSISALGKSSVSDHYMDSPLGKIRAISGVLPGNLLADFIDAEHEPIRALIINSGNPLLSMAGESRLRQAFNKLELIVVIDIYRNATGELADYVLPATDWLERADVNSLGLGFQLEPFAQYSDAVVAAKAERKNEWWILARLLHELGMAEMPESDSPKAFSGMERMLSASGLSIAKLKAMPSQTKVLAQTAPASVFEQGVQHDDGRVDCCPAIFAEAIENASRIYDELVVEQSGQLKLINLRTNYMHNSWLHNLPALKRGIHASNPLWMNPRDAALRQLQEGDTVVVSNVNGEITAQLGLDPKLRVGVVAMTHGLGNVQSHGMKVAQASPGVNVNQLLPMGLNSYEKLSNQSHMTGIQVEVRGLA